MDDRAEVIALFAPSPEARVATVERIGALAARVAEELRKRNDVVGGKVWSLLLAWIDLPRDQQSSLSIPIEEIRLARRRIFDVVAAAERAAEGGEVRP